jgi:hypothetical protein
MFKNVNFPVLFPRLLMDTDKKEVVTPLLSTLFYTVTAGKLEPRPNSWTKSRQKKS